MAMYKGLREIAKRMRWKAASTVLVAASRYQDDRFNLPLVMHVLPNNRFIWTTDELNLKPWIQRMTNLTPDQQLKRVTMHKPKIVRRTCTRCGETILGSRGYAAMKKILEE